MSRFDIQLVFDSGLRSSKWNSHNLSLYHKAMSDLEAVIKFVRENQQQLHRLDIRLLVTKVSNHA